MTEQAPPDYYFQNIIFNPKYYDNEVNNNITTYEANNTYLKKPINQNTGLINSVLTLTNTTTKEMQWTTPAVAITNYTNYNSTNKTLISNVSGTPTTITDLVISASIGSSTAQKFVLPSNSSTSTVGQVLSILNATTKTTQWITIPTQISNYTNYDNTLKTLISNVSGTPTTITDLVISESIGSSTPQKFILPSNSSTAINNSVLTINSSNKTTQWLTIPTQISNYTNYNNTLKTLISNVSGTPTTITDLVISESIGSSTPQKFVLPSNTSTAINNSVLTINSSNKTTQWLTIPTQITDYVDYNVVKDTLIRYNNNLFGPETITDLVIGSIGSHISQKFILPSNSDTAIINSVLTLTNTTTRDTEWITIPTQISNYTNFDNTNKTLISNVSGTPTTITDLVISDSIGSITAQKFILPSNTSTAPLNSVLTLSNTSTKATTWVPIPTQISDYVNYNNTTKILNIMNSNNNVTGSIVDLVLSQSIGISTDHKFKLPSNTSTALLNSVLTLTNLSTKSTNWVPIPTQILNYVNYSNPNLISNVSGTPTTISNLSIGDFTCTSIDATSGLIETTGNLQSRGLTIKDTSNVNVATISNSGSFTCTSINSNSGLIETTGNLQSGGLTIKDTSNVDVATISNSGSFTCSSINSNDGLIQTTGSVRSRGLTIRNTSNVDVASISNSGSFSCSSINSSSGLIQTTGNVRSRGLTIRSTLNTDVATISNLGALDCKSVNSSSGLIQTTGFIKSRGLEIQNATPSTIASIDIDGAIMGTSVNVSFGSLTGLRLNARDIEIVPAVITNTAYVGYTYSVKSSTISYNSGSTRAIDLNNGNLIDDANYLVRYEVLINSGTTSRSLSSIAHGLTNTGSAVSSVSTIKYEPGCWTYQKLNTGSEVINNRLYQGSFFYRYNSANGYTVACVLSFSGTGSLDLTVSATAIRII